MPRFASVAPPERPPEAEEPAEHFDDFTPAEFDPADYVARCRRVRVGPSVTLTFENALTLSFRLAELHQFARRGGRELVKRELDWYAGLVPGPRELLAAVAVREPGRRPTPALHALCGTIAAGAFTLEVGPWIVPGLVRSAAAGDRVTGFAFWVGFRFPPAAATLFRDSPAPARVGIDAVGYSHTSDVLLPAVRESLTADWR